MRDLVVAGGGPVGLATALYAARAGLDVVVREPRAGAVDKACGEGLMPGAVAAFTDLGVPLDGHPICGVRYVDAHRTVEARFRHGEGCGVRRTTLHAALTRAVAAAGIPVVHQSVTAVENRGDHVLVDGERVGHLVAADGLHSPVRRLLGLGVERDHQRRFGLRCHVDVEPWTSYVEVHWSRSSEAYVTPVGPGRVGIAVLTDRPRPFADLLAEHPRLAVRVSGLEHSRTRGAGPLRQQSKRRVEGRVLLVGDAAGYVDALTGEGIAIGLVQAQAAVDAVVSGRPTSYEAAYQRIGRRHDLLTKGLVNATRVPLVRRVIVPFAAAVPVVFGAAVNQLARPA